MRAKRACGRMAKNGCMRRLRETYLPLLNALYDLKEEGIRYQLTIGVTPILGEQLSDPRSSSIS